MTDRSKWQNIMKMKDGEIKEALTVQSLCVRECACACVWVCVRVRERERQREIMLEAKGGNECMKLRGEKKQELGQ